MIPATCAADARVGAVFRHVPDLVAIVTYHTLRGVGCYLDNCHIVLHNFREGWRVKSDDCSVGLAYSLCVKHLSLLTSKPPQDVFIRLIRFDFDDSACRVRAVIRFLDLDGDSDDFAIVTTLYTCGLNDTLGVFLIVHCNVYTIAGDIVFVRCDFREVGLRGCNADQVCKGAFRDVSDTNFGQWSERE